ncbi:response regulator transcription factor [Amycolatopsis sp. NPDC001319]|uniref:helix-turn-helix transcriptional regulator n=1 Tax=unclassified Amycolatopsis TaxID=2618356 RepID=UPI0036B67515
MVVRSPAAPRAVPVLEPHEYVAVLLVTAGAYDTVGRALDGVTVATELTPVNEHVLKYRIEAAPAARGSEPRGQLTPRELDVLRCIARGFSRSETARELFVSTETVKTHTTHVLRKLGARDRAHAVDLGYRLGLLGGAS